jgi:transcriptional regulator with XRE-family HTH domain
MKRVASFSERLKEALHHSGKRQVDISIETGIDKGSISNYLNGRYEPKFLTAVKLAQALAVSEMWLMGFDVPKERG